MTLDLTGTSTSTDFWGDDLTYDFNAAPSSVGGGAYQWPTQNPAIQGSNTDKQSGLYFELEKIVTDDSNVVPYKFVSAWKRVKASGLSAHNSRLLCAGIVTAASGETRLSGDHLAIGSVEACLDFWDVVREEFSEPDLGITPDGDITLDWYKDTNNALIILAKRDRSYVYSLYRDNKPHNGCFGKDEEMALARLLSSFAPNPLLFHIAD